MRAILQKLSARVGETPLLRYEPNPDQPLGATLLLKVEGENPGGSVKDRAARQMILTARDQGLLPPGGSIIEPTSGNTGIGLAWIGAEMGYRVILTMPASMTEERKLLLRAYGAELILTPPEGGMKAAIAEAQRLLSETPGGFMPNQFENPENPAAHFQTTGPEIWEATEGQVDVLVAGVGTGGTITGTGAYLRQRRPEVSIVAVEPADSPVLSGGKPGPHSLQGIGAGFVPAVLDRSLLSEIIQVTGPDAFQAARDLRTRTGLLVGISSGAALWAALSLAARPEAKGKTLVVVLPDSGERYLSTPLFE